MASDTFDAIVIGAGPAGEVVSGRLGQAGLSVAVAEGHLVGGECSFSGARLWPATPAVPDTQRGLAPAARGVRPLARRE
jgi:flavin-dependent dehydrogenase